VSLPLNMRSSLSNCTVLSFIFALQEFARELVSLVDAMERISLFEQQATTRNWWGWLRSWFPTTLTKASTPKNPLGGEKRRPSGLKRRLCRYSHPFYIFLSSMLCLLQPPYLPLDINLLSQRFAHMHRTRYKRHHGPT
jgi:hypothetical protein